MKPLNRGDNPDTADTSGETLGFVVATAALLHASNLQLKLTKRFIEQLLGCKLSCPLSPFSQTLQQNVFLELVRNGVPVDGCFQCTLVVVCSNGQGYFKSVPREARAVMTGCFFSGARLKRREAYPIGPVRWLPEDLRQPQPQPLPLAAGPNPPADGSSNRVDPGPGYYCHYTDDELASMHGMVQIPTSEGPHEPLVIFPILEAYNIVVVLEEESRSGARAHDPAATAASGRHGSSAAGGSSARASAFEGGRRSSAGGASHQEHAHAHDGPSWTPGGRTPMTLRSESMPAAAGFAGSGLKESPGQSVRAASCTLGELQEQKQEQGVPGASTTDGAIQLAPATQQQPLQVLQLQPQLQPQPGMSVPVLMLAQPGSAGSCQMQQVGGNWAQLPAAPAPGPVPFRGSASGGGAEAMQVTPFEWPVMPVHIMAMEQQSQAATTAVAPQQQGTAPSSEPSMGSQQIVSSPALTARTISAPPPSTTQQLQSFVIRDVQSGSSTGTAPAPAAQLVCPLPHPQPQPQQQQLQTPIPRQPMQLQPAPQLQPVHMQVPQTIQLQPQTQVQQIQLQPQLMFAPQHTQQVLQLAPAQRQQQQQQQAPMILSTGSQAGQQMQMGTVQTYGSACSPAPPAGGYVLVSAGAPRGQMFMTQGQDGGVLQLQQYVPVQTSSTSGSTILYNSIGSGMQLFQGTGLMAPQQFQPVQLHPSSAPQAAPLATSHGNQMMQPIQLQPAPQLAPHAAPSAANHPNTGSVLRWLQGQPQMQGVGELQQPPGAFTFPGTTSSQGLPTVIPISSLPTAMVQAHAAAQQDSGGVPPTKKVCLG